MNDPNCQFYMVMRHLAEFVQSGWTATMSLPRFGIVDLTYANECVGEVRSEARLTKRFDSRELMRAERERVEAATPRPLNRGEELALAVLCDNAPDAALSDWLQENGVVPRPRDTVKELLLELASYAEGKAKLNEGKYWNWHQVSQLIRELAKEQS